MNFSVCRRVVFVLAEFLCLACATSAMAQPHAPTTQSQPAFDTSRPLPEFHKLDNGLRLCIVEDHALPLVSVQLWYRTGSIDNAPSQAGLTHVLRSHLAHRDGAAETAVALGLRFESRTLWDACYFTTTLPREYLDIALDFEAGRMRPAKLTADEFRAALDSATRETHMSFASDKELLEPPADRDRRLTDEGGAKNLEIERRILATLFGEHPYSRPPEFVAASLADASIADVNDFARRWFVPGAATLFVIGDVSSPRVLDTVQRNFGALQWSEPPRRPARDALDPAFCEIVDGKEHYLAWRLGSTLSPESAGLRPLVCGILDRALIGDWRLLRGSEASVLTFHPTLSSARSLTRVMIESHRTRDPNEVPKSFKPETAAADAKSELESIVQRVPNETDWNLARSLAWRNLIESRETFSDRAFTLCWSEIVAGDLLLADFEERALLQCPVGELGLAATVVSEACSHTSGEAQTAQSPIYKSSGTQTYAVLGTLPTRPALTPVSLPWLVQPANGNAATRCEIPGFPRAWYGRKSAASQGGIEFPLREYCNYHGITPSAVGDDRVELLIPSGKEECAEELLKLIGHGRSAITASATSTSRPIAVTDYRTQEILLGERFTNRTSATLSFRFAVGAPDLDPDDLRMRALRVLLQPCISMSPPMRSNQPRAELAMEWHDERDFAAAVRFCARRISRLATGEVPDGEIADALLSAQVMRRLELDSPAAVGRAVATRAGNPWDAAFVTPADFVKWLQASLCRTAPIFTTEKVSNVIQTELRQMKHSITEWAALPD